MDPLSSDDPGWLPQGGASGANGLLTIRLAFLAFCSAVVLVGLTTLIITGTGDPGEPVWDPLPTAIGVLCLGVVQYGLGALVPPKLVCGTATEVAERWRARFFLRIAIAEAGALFGFIGALQAVSPLPYLFGLVPAAFGFARNAPTAANLQRDQEELDALGCPERLVPAIVALRARRR